MRALALASFLPAAVAIAVAAMLGHEIVALAGVFLLLVSGAILIWTERKSPRRP